MTYDEAELRCYLNMLKLVEDDNIKQAELKQCINSVYGRMTRQFDISDSGNLFTIVKLAAHAAESLRGNSYSYSSAQSAFDTCLYWCCHRAELSVGATARLGNILRDMMDEIHQSKGATK